jgi:hypothetical protein
LGTVTLYEDSLYVTKFIRTFLSRDKVHTRQSLYGDKVYTRTKFIQTRYFHTVPKGKKIVDILCVKNAPGLAQCGPTGHDYHLIRNAKVKPVLRIRIRRIRMFLGLLDPDPDPLVRRMDPDPPTDPDPNPSIIKQK